MWRSVKNVVVGVTTYVLSIPRGRRMRALLLALLLIGGPAMACEWKWEITYWSGGKTWKEEIVASNRQDAEQAARARNPHAKIIGRNPVCR